MAKMMKIREEDAAKSQHQNFFYEKMVSRSATPRDCKELMAMSDGLQDTTSDIEAGDQAIESTEDLETPEQTVEYGS